MKGIIIYKTKYGTTKQYANWLSQELGFKTYHVTDNEEYKEILPNADIVIIGSPIFNSQPKMKTWIKSQWDILKDKNVILYTTSATPPTNQKFIAGVKNTFSNEISTHMKYYPLGGRLLLSKLDWIDRQLMKIGRALENDPVVKGRMKEDVDNVDLESVKPIIKYINSL